MPRRAAPDLHCSPAGLASCQGLEQLYAAVLQERIDTVSKPLVSIVMPSLNQSMFVEAAVTSALDQDYPDLELVVADGGSSDGTQQLLASLQARYGRRLQWFSEADTGPANAINKALQRCRGEIVGWLNADDLYCPDAIRNVVGFFQENPDCLMVYGEADHVDADGTMLGRYPTKPSCRDIQQFHGGCFICQPTVFMRRSLLDTVGGLDESLCTAFDFDLWLRIYKTCADRVGYLPTRLACSRLHDTCITRTQRRQVALEGLQVVSRHLGHASADWLLSYVEESFAKFPFETEFSDIREHLNELVEESARYLDAIELARLRQRLAADMRLKLAIPGVCVMVQPDGWALHDLVIRIKRLHQVPEKLWLECLHAWPVFRPITLTAVTSWGEQRTMPVEKAGLFCLEFALPDSSAGKQLEIRIQCDDSFVPQQVVPGSSDQRQLCFLVKDVQLKRNYSIGAWLLCLKKIRSAEKK